MSNNYLIRKYEFKRILVAYDSSNLSKKAIYNAITLAKKFSSEIIVVSVIVSNSFSRSFLDMNTHETIIEKNNLNSLKKEQYALIKTAKANKVRLTTKIIISSQISQSILSFIYSSKPDLVILGTRGKGNDRKLMLGSVSMQVSQNSPVPVLLTK